VIRKEERKLLDERAIRVPCPLCGAGVGEACTIVKRGAERRPVVAHAARIHRLRESAESINPKMR